MSDTDTRASSESEQAAIDRELLALATPRRRESVLRPVLMIAVIVLGAWIISDWRSELEYFFSSSEPIELGEATDIAIEKSKNPDYEPDITHNRLVSITGIPTQRSQSARYRFFRLVGSWIYVEQKRDDYIEDPIERELQGEQKGPVDRTYYQGAGRALHFREIPERYRGLRHYYRTRYNTVFCDELSEQERKELQQQQRDGIVQQWRLEYKDATPEEREQRNMRMEPTQEEIDAIVADEPVCVDAYLIQDGVQPRDHWWYVAAAGMFLAFMLFNFVLLIRWIIRFLRP